MTDWHEIADERAAEIVRLDAQIDAMKCCGNCIKTAQLDE